MTTDDILIACGLYAAALLLMGAAMVGARRRITDEAGRTERETETTAEDAEPRRFLAPRSLN